MGRGKKNGEKALSHGNTCIQELWKYENVQVELLIKRGVWYKTWNEIWATLQFVHTLALVREDEFHEISQGGSHISYTYSFRTFFEFACTPHNCFCLLSLKLC